MHASTSTHRARWAAIGAAVAVSLGAGGLGIVTATSPEGASAYVAISPCRLLDTRADSPVGSPLGALGPDTEITVDGWGTHGNCTLPTGTTGLELNVTAVDASTLTNLRIYPEGVDTPTASNLNPAPGEPPTPNSVSATLNATNGQFHVFNRFGTVHIVIDVVGYYADHVHDKTLSLPITGAVFNNVTFSGALPGGLRLGDNAFGAYSSLDHSFVLPDDYTPGTPITVDLTWVIGASCKPDLSANNLTVTRPDIPRISGLSTNDGLSIEATPTASANVVNSTAMTIVSPDPTISLEPGDAVVFGLFRRGDGPGDTCTGEVLVLTGMTVRYQ